MAEKSLRGFAAMDRAKQRAIASKGGRAAHAKGTAHEFTPEEARAAGRKGGQAAHAKGTAHEFTSEEARQAGRKGGQSSHGGQSGGRQKSESGTGSVPDGGMPSEIRTDDHAFPNGPNHSVTNETSEWGNRDEVEGQVSREGEIVSPAREVMPVL